ncbi:MAG: hypothetical protein WD314_11325 [Trueperaceae bacterium]
MKRDFPLHTDLSLAYRAREAASRQDASLLVLLHGVGSNERDLLGLESMLDERFHVISARAPIELGPDRYGWFNIEFSPVHVHNAKEAEASRMVLIDFIDELVERYEVPFERVYLMGFSQGAVLSLSVALTEPAKIGGIVALSGRVLEELRAELTQKPEHLRLSVLLSHGIRDEVLPIHHAHRSRALLEQLPVDLEYHEYDVGHGVGDESVADVVAWLGRRLNQAGRAPGRART